MIIGVVEWVHEVWDKVVIDVACHNFGMEPVKVDFESLHTVLLRYGVFFVALAFDRYGGIVVKIFVVLGKKHSTWSNTVWATKLIKLSETAVSSQQLCGPK